MNILSDNALSKIKDAETRAHKIVEKSEYDADRSVKDAEIKAQNKYEKELSECREKYRAETESITERSAETVQKSDSEARAEAEAVIASAETNMRTAVKEIIWELMQKCQ